MARKGWERLSEAYRERLSRKLGSGAREKYESGASLSTARGHARLPGRGSERFERLARKADRGSLPEGVSGREVIREAIAQGMSMAAIDRLLTAKEQHTQEYRATGHSAGGTATASTYTGRWWNGRTRIRSDLPSAFYWYH